MKEYYDRRAPVYDEWWLAAAREREGWEEELAAVLDVVNGLPRARTLDVACGTGFVTRRLEGEVVGVDQSERMLEIARERAPQATFLRADALELPFPERSFGRVFASYFYCHLLDDDRARFVAEARRVAPEIVVLGSRRTGAEASDRWEQRPLPDGSSWPVYKRVFEPHALAAELAGEVLHAGRWFVAVRAS